MDNRPLGVFDSGLGGLSVVRQLMRRLPGESIVYFGDTARVPYGTRSRDTIEKYARQACRFLLEQDVKLIIAACGTVSSAAPHVLAQQPVPALGVVEPTADAAARATRNGRIGVLGTAATVSAGAFRRRILAQRPDVQVWQQPCPLFVPLVENGWIDRDDEVTRLVAARYLAPLQAQDVDTVVLGCTHYPLLKALLGDLLGDDVVLIDAGRETADACARRLADADALRAPHSPATPTFYVSDRPEDFVRVADMFLGCAVEGAIHTLDIEAYSGAAP